MVELGVDRFSDLCLPLKLLVLSCNSVSARGYITILTWEAVLLFDLVLLS